MSIHIDHRHILRKDFAEVSLLSVDLTDGRTISVPLAWYPRLLHASADQRNNWELCGGGFGIHSVIEIRHF